jgi:hypothetical protein
MLAFDHASYDILYTHSEQFAYILPGVDSPSRRLGRRQCYAGNSLSALTVTRSSMLQQGTGHASCRVSVHTIALTAGQTLQVLV